MLCSCCASPAVVVMLTLASDAIMVCDHVVGVVELSPSYCLEYVLERLRS